jgi:hypothetical protein
VRFNEANVLKNAQAFPAGIKPGHVAPAGFCGAVATMICPPFHDGGERVAKETSPAAVATVDPMLAASPAPGSQVNVTVDPAMKPFPNMLNPVPTGPEDGATANWASTMKVVVILTPFPSRASTV